MESMESSQCARARARAGRAGASKAPNPHIILKRHYTLERDSILYDKPTQKWIPLWNPWSLRACRLPCVRRRIFSIPTRRRASACAHFVGSFRAICQIVSHIDIVQTRGRFLVRARIAKSRARARAWPCCVLTTPRARAPNEGPQKITIES